ncbi:MAG: hypothetical protein U9R47_02820, partial [Actinomycetota bacterium]|nr:hypothetical protein [Actinomycetota bacterium]
MTAARTQMRRIATLYVALALLAVSIVLLAAPRAEAANPGGNGWIVFESGFDLWAIASDGSGTPVNLTTSGEAEADPVFSPDGTTIALSRDVSGSADIWTAAFDPSGPSLSSWVKVSNGGADGQPTWSPDGSTIAFERMITWTPVIT